MRRITKFHIEPKFIIASISMLFIFCLCGCNNSGKKVNSLVNNKDNPFKIEENKKEQVNYSFGYGVESPDPNKRVLTYNGKDVKLTYALKNDSAECTIGIMIYVNGMLQPYRIENKDKEETMNEFFLKTGESKKIIITFRPIMGRKNDKLTVHFVTMLNPKIEKYTPQFVTFGNNQKITQLLPWRLKILKDLNNTSNNIYENYKTTPMSDEFKSKFIKVDRDGRRRNKMDNTLNIELAENNEIINTSTLSVNKNETKNITIKIYGGNVGKYRVSAYIDHKLVPFKGKYTYTDLTVKRDYITTTNFVLDGKRYLNNHNFYVVAVPLEGDTSFLDVRKSNTIVLKHK